MSNDINTPPTPVTSETGDSASASLLREVLRLQEDNAFMKKKVLRAWSTTLIITTLAAGMTMAMVKWYPKYRYAATLDNRAICEIPTIAEPFISNAAVADFAKEAMLESYSYGYINYRESIDRVTKKYFSSGGRKSFLDSLKESGNLDKIIKGRLYLKSSTIGVAQIQEEGVLNGGNYYWDVVVPVQIAFFVGGEDRPQVSNDFFAKIRVVREPPSAVNMRGVAVDFINLKPYSKGR